MMKRLIIASALATALSLHGGVSLAANETPVRQEAQEQDQEQIYGSQLMTQQERTAYRTKNGKKVDVYMSVIRSHFTPDFLPLQLGDEVTLHVTSQEQAYDQTHGFAIDMYNVNLSLEPGKYEEVKFVADRAGVFPFYCTEFCSCAPPRDDGLHARQALILPRFAL